MGAASSSPLAAPPPTVSLTVDEGTHLTALITAGRLKSAADLRSLLPAPPPTTNGVPVLDLRVLVDAAIEHAIAALHHAIPPKRRASAPPPDLTTTITATMAHTDLLFDDRAQWTTWLPALEEANDAEFARARAAAIIAIWLPIYRTCAAIVSPPVSDPDPTDPATALVFHPTHCAPQPLKTLPTALVDFLSLHPTAIPPPSTVLRLYAARPYLLSSSIKLASVARRVLRDDRTQRLLLPHLDLGHPPVARPLLTPSLVLALSATGAVPSSAWHCAYASPRDGLAWSALTRGLYAATCAAPHAAATVILVRDTLGSVFGGTVAAAPLRLAPTWAIQAVEVWVVDDPAYTRDPDAEVVPSNGKKSVLEQYPELMELFKMAGRKMYSKDVMHEPAPLVFGDDEGEPAE
ncbi:hypothetical protein AMAG_18820 [Allomyces macrogynus ATCC 38327]|uniref:Uncharacterized protein n=1 Tax=Allomyces macrogynus (strain ATCC 38327) TaxID=578462 RepID=A0A0L0SIL2_ALLM3|nr:hypothetical protein AMAG_18820 [Allomyces macrogynus ATCC 38327]|eukprot:KNE62180.1 hypothetical protein AMAG_18820 [Allomyces macrogynus ATCC 38327]